MRAVGIDVGGTKCRVTVVDLPESIVGATARPSASPSGTIDDIAVVFDAKFDTPTDSSLGRFLAERVIDCGDVDVVGVGMPGIVTRDGIVRTSPHLPWVTEWRIGDELARHLGGRRVTIDNDATCATVAEWAWGAGRGCDDMWLVTLGTGIGGGLIAGGAVRRGAHGHAGEIGHVPLGGSAGADRDARCPCGQRGCWELFASGSALARRGACSRGEDVVARVRAGDAAALAAVDDWADAVARGLAMLVNVSDPQRIVIGGGVSEAADVVLEPIRRALPTYCYGWPARDVPDVVVASLGERAGALGAALLARIV